MLRSVTPRGVDLLCGRGLSAVLFQLHDGKAAENTDRKLCSHYSPIISIWICELQQFIHTHYEILAANVFLILLPSSLPHMGNYVYWSAFLSPPRSTRKKSLALPNTHRRIWLPHTVRMASWGYGNLNPSPAFSMEDPESLTRGYKAILLFYFM